MAEPQRRGLLFFWLDGLFAAGSEAFFAPYLALYLLALGASGQQVGMLSAVVGLAGAVMFLPGARLAERLPSYRSVVVATSLAARTMLALLVMLPWVASGQPAIYAVLLLAALREGMAQLGNPAWTAFSAQIVPQSLRGRFFAARTLIWNLATLLCVPLAGRMIKGMGSPQGYQVAFAVAFCAGLAASVIYAQIPLPLSAPRTRAAGPSLREALQTLGQHRTFVSFALITMVLNLGVQLVAPFFNVYLVRQLGADASFVGLQTTLSALASMVAVRLFGPLVDRHGLRWTMLRCGPFVALIPFGWLFVRQPWQTLPVAAIGAFAWGGFNLATFNLLLASTPDEGRPLYSALFNTASAVSLMIGPLIGGYMFDHWGFRYCLIASCLGRGSAMVLVYALLRGPAMLGRQAGRAGAT
ncbi:MAG: MFS transporter [Anaerolineae bacterium]